MALKLPPRFANLPADILFDTTLPDAVFRTLAQLHGLAWQTKGERTPPATVTEFARLRGLKERRMYDHLRELKKLGFIRVENLGHGRIIIFPLRWDLGAALPADDDLLAQTDAHSLPLRWEPDTALSPSVSNDDATAINCSNISNVSQFTAKDCSKTPDSADSTAINCSKTHSSSRSSCFKNSDSEFKKQRQQTKSTAKNCSKIPADYQPVLELLTERCGTPTKIAREAVCAAAKFDDDPVWVQHDVLRWLAYCQSKRGKTINARVFSSLARCKKQNLARSISKQITAILYTLKSVCWNANSNHIMSLQLIAVKKSLYK